MKTATEMGAAELPVYELDTEATYTVEVVAHLTGISTQTILYYREQGLIASLPKTAPDAPQFDHEALRTLRRLEHLRTACQLSEPGLKLVSDLLNEIERLRAELRGRR